MYVCMYVNDHVKTLTYWITLKHTKQIKQNKKLKRKKEMAVNYIFLYVCAISLTQIWQQIKLLNASANTFYTISYTRTCQSRFASGLGKRKNLINKILKILTNNMRMETVFSKGRKCI